MAWIQHHGGCAVAEQQVGKVGDAVDDVGGARVEQPLGVVGPGTDSGDDRGAGAAAAEYVAVGVTAHGDVPYVVDAQPERGGKHEIGPRPSASDIGGAYREVDAVPPAERV